MRLCTKCGAKALPHQDVCSACGESLPDLATDQQSLVGQTIAGTYEVTDIIGEGAMGRVYRARQITLDKWVAIKVLHRHLAQDPKVAKRFHREARAASRLQHPNVLGIIDFDATDEGMLYLAMELLEGRDLLEVILEDFPFAPERVVNIMRQVLIALDEAHSKGIIHRDFKPENVIVASARDGTDVVKVCDFGIAKIQEEEGSGITVTGFVCGTPEYMAPEQARGEALDARVDIYAAGVMLYQMLAGVVPFKADSALGTITKHLMEEPVAPSVRRPDIAVPIGLEAICLKAMSKNRENRYGSASEMLEAVSHALDSDFIDEARAKIRSMPPASPILPNQDGPSVSHSADTRLDLRRSGHAPSAKRVSALTWFVAAAILSAAIVTAVLLSTATPSSTRPQTRSLPPRENVDSGGPPSALASSLSPDASVRVAISHDGSPDANAEKRRSHSDESTSTASASISPSASDSGATIHRTASPSSTPEKAPNAAPSIDATSSPGEIAFAEGRRLFLANEVGGAIAKFEEAAQLMPRNPNVQKQLGRAYMRTGNVAQGARAYRRYLELAPDAPDRAIIEQMISSTR